MVKEENNILLWLRIIRPQTLFASLCPVLVGLLILHQAEVSILPLSAAMTACCALSLQILSNLINDLYDFLRGADKQGRQGFKRALAEGEVMERQIRTACWIMLGISLVLGAYLLYLGGWVIGLIGVSAILFAWLYTATGHSLSYLGIADLFVYLYYGVIATMGTIWIQLPYYNAETSCLLTQAWWAGSVNGICSMCVLMINNLRDREDDAQVGKKTLPVRFGKRIAELVMLVIILLAPVCAWLAFGNLLVCLIVLPMLLLWIRILRAKGMQYNRYLMMAGLCNVLWVVLVMVQGISL